MTSDCTASSITSASVDDEKTDHHHQQQQQQQDSVANITDDTSHVIPVTESEDQSTAADTQHSSSRQFLVNDSAVSTDKLPAGTRLFYGHHVCAWKSIIFCSGSFLFRTPSLNITEQHSTKLCRMFESSSDLKKDVQNLGIPPLKRGTQKLFSGGFMTDIATQARISSERTSY